MPVTVSYPGVYLEEIPSGVRTITGVATSVAAFVDFFAAGPMNKAVQILSLASFNKQFGGSDPSGLDPRSEGSYAVQQFFLNGGTQAYVVRVGSLTATPANPGTPAVPATGTTPAVPAVPATPATTNAPAAASVGVGDGKGGLAFVATAASPGAWGNGVVLGIDHDTTDPTKLFNLTVTETITVNGTVSVASSERFLNLLIDPAKANDVAATVNARSQLIRISQAAKDSLPAATGTVSQALPAFDKLGLAAGDTCDVLLDGTKVDKLAGLPDTLPGSYAALAATLQSQIRALGNADNGLADATVSVGGSASTQLSLNVKAGAAKSPGVLTFQDGAGGLASKLKLAGVAGNVPQYRLGGATAGQQLDSSGTWKGTPGSDGTWTPGSDPGAAKGIIGNPVNKTGLYALYDVDLFNLLCVPATANMPDADAAAVAAAAEKLCTDRRAFYLLDVPQVTANRDRLDGVKDWLDQNATLRSRNAAVYFPRVDLPDPLNGYRTRPTPPSGTMAGVFATTDATRGVWKAPAGTEATLAGVQGLEYALTDLESGVLNPLAINCLRRFPVYGPVAYGARTLKGADQISDDYKYIPVRRLALYIEESLYRGTQWVVFEPNDEPLWAQIRLNVGAFMHELFRQGAFQGKAPKDAYFVKCDGETTPQDQINLGIVNVVVGFAPLKPAEFVVIQLQQMAGQIDT